jgi:DNA phosphorothioation-dependent restriction protein DptH
MHSMSNQFYDYITESLLSFFKDTQIKPGDRYYLQLDKPEDVQSLVESLQNQENVKQFIYKHEFGDPYITFSIEINDVQLIIANTSETVNPDFLVTLRNQVGEQQNVWRNTALFTVVSEQLDSIQGGSSDLQKDGMPLHPHSIVKKLKQEIEDSTLDKVDQIILLDNMQMILQEQMFQQITFFDFEEIFTTLSRGYIEDKDFKKFGLFKDPDLATFSGSSLKKRMELNRELFDYVRKVHDFGYEDDELDRKFSSTGTSKLKGEDWSDLSFFEVNKYYEERQEINKKTSVDVKELVIKGGLKYWDKPHKETVAGHRKRHLIIFNPDHKSEIELTIAFTFQGGIKSLLDQYVTVPNASKKDVTVDVGRINLTAKITARANETTFVKFSYRHEKKSGLGAEFHIAVVPIEEHVLDSYKTSYVVEPSDRYIGLQTDQNEIAIGSGMNEKNMDVSEYGQFVRFGSHEKIIAKPQLDAFNDEEELLINFQVEETEAIIPVLLKNEIPESIPITTQRIWKLKRENSLDFERVNNRLIFGNREFYMNAEDKQFFDWEQEWIKKGMKCAEVESEKLVEVDLDLSSELKDAYSRFMNYFRIKRNIPSLCHYNEDLMKRAKEYVSSYMNEIKSFDENEAAGKRGRDLFKLGVVSANQTIYFSPFHPLLVAFQIQLYTLLSNEEIDNNILNRLKPDSLIPLINLGKEQLYKPDHQSAVTEWLIFKPVNQVTVSDANRYLAKLIEDKIAQFEEHFGYLFSEQSKAPLQINLISIENDYEVLRGIVNWILNKIENKGIESVKTVEITLYRENNYDSAFDLFSRTDSIEDFQSKFNIKLSSKYYEPQDLLRTIRAHLSYYKQPTQDNYKYAHISFYKMHAQEQFAVQPMADMVTGISLDGLFSNVPSMKGKENYRSGFGIKAYSLDEKNLLVQIAYYFNELSANLRNEGNDTYRKGEAIFSRTTTADEKVLESIFSSSYWVTFVDPSIDLEFFNEYGKNLVVIHYNDQYSSSSRYDAITVTDKSQQYFSVIKEFLKKKEVSSDEGKVKNTIKAFNTFNGEWLLRIIGSKGHYSKEKLSIISAIKFSLAYFDHPEILWVPISLEEILRVAGAVSLNKSEGVFTAKNLGVKGSHSDDLLLIGLEQRDQQLFMHFYPVEVKIGFNRNEILDKAKKQVSSTKKLIMNALGDPNEKAFTRRFYRNFFAQLFISNANKLKQSQFWESKNYELTEAVFEKLLKDRFTLATHLYPFIGDGAILSFQRDAFHRSSHLEDGVTYLNLTEYDGYSGLIQSMEDMREWIQDKEGDLVKEQLLSKRYDGMNFIHQDPMLVLPNDHEQGSEEEMVAENPIDTSVEEETISLEVEDPVTQMEPDQRAGETDKDRERHIPEVTEPGNDGGAAEIMEEKEDEVESLPLTYSPVTPLVEAGMGALEDTRILIGRAENSNKNIYWEYGNKGIANRHLLISGSSGQGKTYFMQCLLLEKAKQGISSIVIDYTEGFLPNQLEEEFVQALGPQLQQQIVFTEQLPINPFLKNVRDIGGITLPESNTDVAERIKSVFASVYKTLGIQQLNAIYDAILTGLDRYQDEMSLPLLREILEEDASTYAKTALSQIRPLIDRNPFSNKDPLNWQDIVESKGTVFVIQLTGYPRDVQLIITEFVLWDLWNYAVRFGNKNKPIPIIMDEAQNLDHSEKSPSARILTEGRKFGLSAWYATQFLKSQLSADELARLQNASQKVYFAQPEQEVSYVAAGLSNTPADRKLWENKLSSLKKGQCIVHGPIRKDDGELSKPVVTMVDITSLSERI